MGIIASLRSVARFKKPTFSPTSRRLARAANVMDLRDIARRRLPGGIFDYIDGGAEDERTMRENSDAFARWSFVPRVLRDVSRIDISTEILGEKLPAPIIFSPTGFTRIAHSQGELAVARVAARHGLPYSLSTMSTRSIEEVADVGEGTRWFQVYVWRDRDMVRDMLSRAAAHGFSAIQITVDTAILGRRERDVRRGFTLPPELGPGTIASGLRHPGWTWDFVRAEPITFSNVERYAGDRQKGAVNLSLFIASQFDPTLSWNDITWFRENWPGKIILKGIQSVEDALLAQQHDVDAIMVSNHGGRQLDGAPAPIDIIAPIREAVGASMCVILDGGVRRGSDIIKAVALGANAVTMGRTYLWGLGAAGERGVEAALGMLTSEMRRSMALAGLRSLAEIDSSTVARTA